MCKLCYVINAIGDDEFLEEPNATIFTEKEYNEFLEGVYNGTITTKKLPENFYSKTANFLESGLFKGLGSKTIEAAFETPDWVLTNEMRINIYQFSAAKTYQQARALTELVVDKEGNVVPFSKYKKEAQKILTNFNSVYLGAERDTALASGRAASDWATIKEDKKFLPLLQYQTVGDARVRPQHARLDNITKTVDSSFWDTYYPPNGWRCRCTTIQLTREASITKTKKADLPIIDPLFAFNPGKEKIVFQDKGENKHPYFIVKREDKDLKQANFGFDIPPMK